MSNSLPDITLTSGVWTDIYAVTGLSPGLDLIIKNKSTSVAYVQVKAAIPVGNTTDGWPLNPLGSSLGGDWTVVTSVPSGSRVWVRGNGKFFVQELD